MRLQRRSTESWHVLVALCAGAVSALLPSQRALAAPLRVGPGQAYTTPCEAIAAAAPGDEIDVDAATYTDSCAITVAGLTLRGVGGQPTIDLSGTDHPAEYKGIYVIEAEQVTIENLELTGAHISADNGENAAGIRVEAADLTVQGCNIHDNQNGILGGTTGTVTIEHTEFFHNGMGDGCNNGGCTHNVYVAGIDRLNFRFNWSHAIATDTPDKGHLLKSRAKANYIEYNRLSGEDGFDSYEIDLPNGGYAQVIGNAIEKGSASGNSTLLIWGEEGASNPETDVLVVDNTFVNDADNGIFISAAGATLTVNDNLFVGPGTPLLGASISSDNLSGIDPRFADRAHYDYHLMAGSPAIGHGVSVPAKAGTSLNAQFEYVQPLGSVVRASARDVGAFEYATDTSRALDGGSLQADAATGTSDSTAGAGATGGANAANTGGGGDVAAVAADASADHDAGATAQPDSGMNGACSCSVPGSRRNAPAPGWLFAALLLAAALRVRRGAATRSAAQRARARRLVAPLSALLLLACSDADSSDADSGDADSGAPNDAGALAGRARDASTAAPEVTMPHDAAMQAEARDAGRVHDADAAAHATSGDGGTGPCTQLGWCELLDTKLESVCADPATYPQVQADEGCSSVIDDWSGGVADQKRHRLLIWGGGHHGYFGNEVYALELDQLAMRRLNDPSDISSVNLDDCTSPEAYADGRPSSRHTYDGLAYLADADKMFAFAGAGIPCGYAVSGTWTLDLGAIESAPVGHAAPWTNMNPTPYPTKAAYGVVADYDARAGRVIVDDTYNLWSYDLASNTYSVLNDSNATNAHIDYHMTGRVDPEHGLFVVVGGRGADGGGMQVFDLTPGGAYAQQDWTDQVSGCDALLAAESPGFDYDPVLDRMVGWAGGDDVYVFDPDKKECTTLSYGGGPGAQSENGTFGRFRYFTDLDLFAVVNDVGRNAYALRLPP